MIWIQVNGRKLELETELTVLAYLERIGANPKAVAVELNGEILQRDQYPTTALREGALMEVVRMVGGGTPPRAVPPPPPPGHPRAPGQRP